MHSIKLIYWDDVKNIGDQLSPYIIHKLSGLSIVHRKNYELGIKGQLFLIFKLLLCKISFKKFSEIPFFYEDTLLGIGSIISWGNKRSVVWGSGFMNGNEKFRGGKVYAVRGKLTNDRLVHLGFKGCNVWGDPALLLPLLLPKIAIKSVEIAIIPHWTEVDYFKDKYAGMYKIIDVRTDDVESFVNELTSCRYILSTSLHGIILSHAYQIPALWIKHGYIQTDGFKFFDYFSSVDIPFYEGLTDFDSFLQDRNWKQLFVDYESYSLPKKDLNIMRKHLIDVAPFKVLKQYIIK